MRAPDPERRRRRTRRLLLLCSLPVIVALVVVAIKLLSLSVTTQVAISLYNDGAYDSSEKQSTSLLDNNIIEPYIPYFNRGDAKAADQDYTSAIDDFEKALTLAPQSRKCDVRVNLAHSWELLGDIYERGGYHQGAVLLYQAAQDVIAAGGSDCTADNPATQKLDQIGQDVQAKKSAAQRRQDAQDAQNPDDPDGKLGALGDKENKSEQQKQNDDAQNRGDTTGPSQSDKPW